MKLEVPYLRQTTPLNCAPAALGMILHYFGDESSLEDLEKKMDIEDGKGISTIKIADVSAQLGYRTEFFSKHILFNEANLQHKFYQNYGDMDVSQSERTIKEAISRGVKVEEKTLPLEDLLSIISPNCVPIVLLDWNIVKGTPDKGYQGHFVPIVGYDDTNVLVHCPEMKEDRSFVPISRTIFDEARKASGTDEDLIIIYRK